MSKGKSDLFDGTRGNPQMSLNLVRVDDEIGGGGQPRYAPSPKHDPVYGWGSENPIASAVEGQ